MDVPQIERDRLMTNLGDMTITIGKYIEKLKMVILYLNCVRCGHGMFNHTNFIQ